MAKVAIAYPVGVGGTKVFADQIITHLRSLGYQCEEVTIPSTYFKSPYLLKFPFILLDNWMNFYTIRKMSKQLSTYDLVISVDPHSLCLKHRNMLMIFQHHIRTAYDLFYYNLYYQNVLRKFMRAITAINRRIIDKIVIQWIKRFRFLSISDNARKQLRKFRELNLK